MDAETSKAIIAVAVAIPGTAAISVAGWLLAKLMDRGKKHQHAEAENGEATVQPSYSVSLKDLLASHIEDDKEQFAAVRQEIGTGFHGVHRLDYRPLGDGRDNPRCFIPRFP